MTTLNPIQALYRKIQTLRKHEKVTKQTLSELSREVLAIVISNMDNRHSVTVSVVNKLLTILSPANQRIARLFFVAFLPYTFDSETNTFGKLLKKEASRDTKELAIASFLHESNNDIWTWQEEHVTMEAKPVDYIAKITKAVETGLRDDKGHLTPTDVLNAVFAAGVSVDDVISILDHLTTKAA